MARNEEENHLVIAIGVSAGGLNALKRFFSKLKHIKSSLVIVQHGGAGEELTREMIHQLTKLPVDDVIQGAFITPERVFLCPPRKLISIEEGQFLIQDVSEASQKFATIDWFFNSLALGYKEKAIGVLLSGDGTDGSVGLKAISESGGLTIVQNEETAEHPMMPSYAVEMGFVDHVMKPEDMAEVIREHERFVLKWEKSSSMAHLQEQIGAAIVSICEILFKHSKHDFKHYKTSTMARRIQRRMLVLQIDSVNEYVVLLQQDKKERDSLFNDLLINVTSFFRDPEAFEALKQEVLIPEFKKNDPKKKFRIWVAGCSTGEEAYSMAILAFEVMAELGLKIDLQVIATDIDEDALNIARKGEYPLSISDKMSPAKLEKYFLRRNGRFQIIRQLRECILFSSHNLIHDPPFSQIDLISCRNVLIYLGPHLHKKLIPIFHYSLKPNGYLFLGTSESLASHKDLFNSLNLKYRLAQRRAIAVHTQAHQLLNSINTSYSGHFKEAPKNHEEDLHLIGQRIVLDEFSPKFAIIGEEGQILSVSAGIQEYLEPGEGAFQNNIVKLVIQNLRAPLRSSFNEAKKQKRQIQNQSAVIKTLRGLVKVGIVVQPMPQLGEHTGLYMVVFKDLGVVTDKETTDPSSSPVDFTMVEELERELSTLREELDKTVQDLEASNEELKSSNEELLSMNEELQSANEELEISKEEVQRGNEILLNHNIDLENLLNSTKIATIFLDNKLNIKNFTPAIGQIYDLLPQDIGRPINSFLSKAIKMPSYSYPADLKMDQVVETEVLMPDGRTFLRRKSAYLDKTKKMVGLVVTFVDITELRNSEQLFRTLANAIPTMVFSTDAAGNYIYFSDQWMDFTGLDPQTIKNKGFREIVHPEDVTRAMEAWEDAQKNSEFFRSEYRLRDRAGKYHWHLVMARAMRDATGKVFRWFGSCTNIQQQKELELSLLESQANLIRNQERFNNVAQAVELGVWYCNLPFDILNWSDTVKKHFWCDPEDIITISTFYERLHPDDREMVRLAVEDSISNRRPYDTKFRTLHPTTKEMKWIRAIGWTDYAADGTPLRFDGVTLDMTEEMNSMEIIKNSEWRYSMASKAARELIWDWDLKVDTVHWNESLSTEFGYPESSRKTNAEWWLDHIHPDDRKRVSDGIHDVIERKKEYWADEYRFKKYDGTYAHVMDRGYLQVNEAGQSIRMIGTMSDITERNELLNRTREAVKARDEFLSIASHELKTPLTSMVLQLQSLKRKMERGQVDDALVYKVSDLSLKQSRLLTALIDDMLDVSRISNGKMTFSFQLSDLQDIVQTALDNFSVNLEERKIEIHTELESDLKLLADPFRLEQVVYNLLSNALKYGDSKPIHLRLYREKNHGVIEVRDQGLGIEPENQERIFNLFERAISSNISGLGLGLYISKEIIEAHHGTIKLESRPGQGSTFIVSLPLKMA